MTKDELLEKYKRFDQVPSGHRFYYQGKHYEKIPFHFETGSGGNNCINLMTKHKEYLPDHYWVIEDWEE